MMRFVLAGILVLMAAVIGWMTFDWYRDRGNGVAFGAPFALTDGTGQPITDAAFRGHPSAVFFGFTHCPEVCPTTLVEMDDWLKKLGNEGRNIRAFFVTVDPARDTPEAVGIYVKNVSDRITAISGDPAKVEQMARDFKIYFKKVPTSDGDYTMDHTASVLLLDSSGDYFGTIAYEENGEAALAKLKRLASEG
jgi:protein SCO1/2